MSVRSPFTRTSHDRKASSHDPLAATPMSPLITITVSGESDRAKSTIVHTIRRALKDASLDVRDDGDQSAIAVTTLYEEQTRLAMTHTQCLIRIEALIGEHS